MAEKSGEGPEIFKNLFGDSAGSLSLFTNNPFQRRSSDNAELVSSTFSTAVPFEATDREGRKDVAKDSEKKMRKRSSEKDCHNSVSKGQHAVGLSDVEASLQERKKGGQEGEPLPKKKKKKKEKAKTENDLEDAVRPVLISGAESKQEVNKRSNGVEILAEDLHEQQAKVLKKLKKKDKKVSETSNGVNSEYAVEASTSFPSVGTTERADASKKKVKKAKKIERVVYEEIGAQDWKVESVMRKSKPERQGYNLVLKEERPSREKRKIVDDIEEKFEKRLRESDKKKTNRITPSHSSDIDVEDHEIHEILGTSETVMDDCKKRKRKPVDEEDDTASILKIKKTKGDRKEEERKLLRTIFVGNLSTIVKKKHLVREFSQFGTVETARLRSVALVDTKLPRRAAVITGQVNDTRSSLNAYVVFAEEASAKAALASNMTEFGGKHIRVDMATAPRNDNMRGSSNGVEYDRTRSIFIGNVPFDVEDEDIYAVFANDIRELSVEAIRLPRDPKTSIGKGFGFVLFKTKAGAMAVLGRKVVKLGDRTLRVVRMGNPQQHCKSSRPSTNSKGTSSNINASRLRISGGVSSTPTKGPLPWEGTRSTKLDGRPGKWTLARPDGRKSGLEGAKTSSTGPSPKTRLPKRPAVAARKQAALVLRSGGVPAPKQISSKNIGSKQKKGEKGRKGGLKAKKFKRK